MNARFLIDKDTLFPLLSALQPLCAKRTTVDATTHILLHVGNREAVLKGTDLEVSLQASCPLQESSCTEGTSLLVSGRRFFESVKEMEGVIECRIEQNQLVLQAQSIDLRLNTKAPEEFPPFPERIENLTHLEASDLLSLLDSVAFLIPQNNSNPALNGLLFELGPQGLTMTATDGHCLAQVSSKTYSLEAQRSWLMPRRAVFELKKLIENSPDKTIFLGTCDGNLVFSGELFNFFTRLIAQPFPEYSPVLERTGFAEGKLERQAFIKTLRRSACLLSGQFLATQFRFAPGSLHVSFNNKGIGTLDEQLLLPSYSGSELEIRFYAPYLLEGLNVISDQQVTFFLRDGTRPLIITSTNKEIHFTYLVMPVSPQLKGA